MIREPTIIYEGSEIGENLTTGHFVLIREGCRIGNNVSIGSFCDIENDVTIESDVIIHSRVFIPAFTHIQRYAWIGPNVTFTNDKYPGPSEKRVRKQRVGVIVCENATIGAGAIILPGVVIFEGAIVGAGAVVTKDVEAGTTVVGNPAREMK